MKPELRARALLLALKAEGFAKFLRDDGPEHHHPSPDDYDELAAMIRALLK